MKITLYPKYLFRSLFVTGRQEFFSAGYKMLHPECCRLGMTPWQHYVTEGRRKGFGNGCQPSDTIFFGEGYLLEYPDIKAAGVDPWRHYAEKGLAEGRDNGLHPGDRDFFAAGYLEMYPDVLKSGMDPWHHYVLKGRKERRDNGLHPGDRDFFAAGYLEMYPDAAKSGMDPWHHYVLKGRKEGRDNGLHPGEHVFSAGCYTDMYRDMAQSGMDPWHHYVMFGKKEGRHKKRTATFESYTSWILDLNTNKKFFVPDDDRSYERHPNDPKIFAYYLPQFHAIPINDQNYGKGFTEWSNVARATPLFRGHCQPNIPYDLGFYSLDHAEILERQAALARQYGIYGFCFYYYWFGGNKVLEKPLKLFLNSKIDLKFHLMWANENWSKLWDGGNKEIILEQKKVDASMADMFYKDIAPYIKDKRYEKINNRPIFAIYRPNFFDGIQFCEFIHRLNELARTDGFDGFYFLGSNYRSFNEPDKYGLEGLIEFPPHGLWDLKQDHDVEWFNLKTNIGIIDLHEWIKNESFITDKPFKLFKCCFPHWDNSPRKAYSYGSVFRMQKDDFYSWLKGIIVWTKEHHDSNEQYVYINAWNEWGEGAYLEPDLRYGYASLNTVRQALEDTHQGTTNKGHSVINAERNCLNDCYMRLAGHDKEAVKTIYLVPDRYRAEQKNSKRVLFIGHEFTVTGAPASLLDIAKLLIADGYIVDIAVKNTPNVSDLHMYDGIGADVFLLPNSTKCVEKSESIVCNYDLVIVNTIIMGAYAELCRTLNIPHLWFVREDLPSIEHYFNIIQGCRDCFLGDSENILCVSKYVTDCVNGKFHIKSRYINNFINDCFIPDSAENQKHPDQGSGRSRTFAVVGSVHKRKSQESVVAAFMYLSATPGYKDRWKLLFIGKYGRECPNPDLGERLEYVTKNIPNIVWCGQVTDNKFDLFRTADFFIVPSLEEASSRVAIEAAMLGKPVIVTSHVGAKYLAECNAGFIYEPGNTAELRDIIIRCLDMTDDEYRKMSHQIRLNYEKTSSPSVYYKALSAIILDAEKRCGALSRKSETAGTRRSVLRSLGSGKNVIAYEHFEYIKYADLSACLSHAEDSVAGKPAKSGGGSSVGVVIPVYNGLEHLRGLLQSLFKNTDYPHRFIFVDDCSGAETSEFLSSAIKGRNDCILVRNGTNLGFVKSINRGAAKALESCGDFVMLNSDTEVPSGWLGRIMKPIFEDEKISSVTPLSNRCNIFSFPFFDRRERNDSFLKEFGLEGINEAIRSSGAGRYINIPTGHGFCMAISGKVWKKIGGLNEALFGRGYGEENEWCQRAELDGFRNVLFPGLYVAHHEKGSFTTDEKKANCAASQQVISVMFPSYMRRVLDFTREYPSADPIASIYLSLARQKGYQPEVFTEPDLFEKRMSEGDGIFAIRHNGTAKVAVKLLGEVIFVGNARNSEKAGIVV